MHCDIGLTPVGGSTVSRGFYSAVSERACAGAPCIPGGRGATRAFWDGCSLLHQSPHDMHSAVVSMETTALCMDSRFIRRQP